MEGGEERYNTARDIFAELKGKELYRTIGFKEIAMIYGDTEASYRKTAKLINRVRWQEEGGTPYRSLQENTEWEGCRVIDYMEEKSKRILKKKGFSEDGKYLDDTMPCGDHEPMSICDEKVMEAAKKCACSEDIIHNGVPYEDPEHTVNISIDDVNVKKQKEERKGYEELEEGKRKYVHNTVVHVGKGGKSYTLNGYGIRAVLLYLIALILNSGLLGCRFQFFTDGHTLLNDTIIRCFSWYKNMGIILDWFHLVKKCKEQLSLGMKGRGVRNEVLRHIMPFLWHGRADKAIDALKEIEDKCIKDTAAVEKLIAYLQRHSPHIPCYAVRKELGLRNSSSIGEKMNDLVVSERQKHNGMSWSRRGSLALASITSLKRNEETRIWFEEKRLNFKLAASA